jgi:translocation and assembly module TamB
VSGTLKVDAERAKGEVGVRSGTARLRVAAVPGRVPLQGDIDVAYDGTDKTIRLGTSQLQTEASRVQVSGVLGSNLQVSLTTSNLDDLLPVASLVSSDVPASLPVRLTQGSASFQGAVTGALTDPRIEGRARADEFAYGDHKFDAAATDVSLRRDDLTLRSIALSFAGQPVEGNLRVALQDFKPTEQGLVSGNLRVVASLEKIVPQTHALCPCGGRVTASAIVEGTVGAPGLLVTLDARKLVMRNEEADRVRASLKAVHGMVDVSSAVVEHAAGTARFSGRYEFTPATPNVGTLHFQTATKELELDRIRYLSAAGYNVHGLAQATASGEVLLSQDGVHLRSLNATASIPELTWEDRAPVGIQASARTEGGRLHTDASILVSGSTATATGSWRLDSQMEGEGSVRFTSLPLAAVLNLAGQDATAKAPRVHGELTGSIAFRGPLRKIDSWSGSLALDAVDLRIPQPGTGKTEYVINNDGAVRLTWDPKGARVVDAKFKGANTNIAIRGVIPLAGGPSLQLDGEGTLNLAALHGINPDVLAGGTARFEVGLRGSPKTPQVTGRLTLNNASLSVEGVPNALEGVNGSVHFNRERATIADKLTGQTGGGRLALTGFVGTAGEDFIYRLQADASGVRVRYPEGVSTTISGTVALTGTSARSLLSGTVNVQRSGFDQQVDVGGMLVKKDARQPEFAVTNAFLRGMDLDLRIRAATNSQFHTPITGDLAMEANLQVRGSVPRPVILGRVYATQGEIDFFGTRYEINSCEIAFLSAARLEPVLNMNLSTQVRGITVNVNFSGTLERLNITYRSDPPLSSQEIIALLTVGRTPTGRLDSGASANIQGSTMQQVPAGSLIGQALMAPLSSRLNRFFGISRVKIDPRVVGFYDTPQAYLTIEQQISKDVTASFSTNLSNSQQQLVRVEWNLNRQWSLAGVREHSTGAYIVEVLYRKIF